MYVRVHSFFEAFFRGAAGLELAAQAVFENCKEGDNPFAWFMDFWMAEDDSGISQMPGSSNFFSLCRPESGCLATPTQLPTH